MIQFWESGYEGSSMQNLVDRMGISRQSLYDTYGNKRDLFEAALARYREEVIEPAVEALSDPSRTPADLIRDHLMAIAEGREGMPLGCLVVRTATEISVDDIEVGQMLNECVTEMLEAMESVIRRGQQRGDFDPQRSARDLAASVIASGMGLACHATTARPGSRCSSVGRRTGRRAAGPPRRGLMALA